MRDFVMGSAKYIPREFPPRKRRSSKIGFFNEKLR
jgi:hypothetical protein